MPLPVSVLQHGLTRSAGPGLPSPVCLSGTIGVTASLGRYMALYYLACLPIGSAGRKRRWTQEGGDASTTEGENTEPPWANVNRMTPF